MSNAMQLFNYSAALPLIFQIDKGSRHRVGEIIREKDLPFHRVVVIHGASFSKQIADDISKSLTGFQVKHFAVPSNDQSCADKLRLFVREANIDLIICVGGGKVIDVGKRAGLLADKAVLAVPTILSNDGLISPIAVLRNTEGKTESLPGHMPIGAIIDSQVILDSPHRNVLAAAGDLLSNFSAVADWRFSAAVHGERIVDPALLLSIDAAESVLRFDPEAEKEEFIFQLTRAQILSGVAMALAKSSRPCSGSEHLIAHAIDYLGLAKNVLHGEIVGAISLFTLWLSRSLQKSHLAFARRVSSTCLFTELSSDIPENIHDIFRLSRTMRPGRHTILDSYSDNRLILLLAEFESEMRNGLFDEPEMGQARMAKPKLRLQGQSY